MRSRPGRWPGPSTPSVRCGSTTRTTACRFLHAYLPTADAIPHRHRADPSAPRPSATTGPWTSAGQTCSCSRCSAASTASPTSSRAVIGAPRSGHHSRGHQRRARQPRSTGRSLCRPDLVRDLAVEPGTLFYRIIKDPLGHILDITELGRFPSEKAQKLPSRSGTARVDSRPATGRPWSRTRITRSRTPADRPAAFQPAVTLPPAPQHQDPSDRRTHPLRDAMPRTSSRLERDLATFLVHVDYAA